MNVIEKYWVNDQVTSSLCVRLNADTNRTGSSGRTVTGPITGPKNRTVFRLCVRVVPLATGTGCIVYYHYILYDKCISFGTEIYLSRAKTVTVCSLSYSWWEGPDVIWPELPAGRSGPVRAFDWCDLPDQTRRPVRFRPDAFGVQSFPTCWIISLRWVDEFWRSAVNLFFSDVSYV